MNTAPTLAPDAAIVLGIAATAIPFARTPEEEAERWLRVLRLHGEVGTTLQALGVSEASIRAGHKDAGERRESAAATPSRGDVVGLVTEHAAQVAGERGASGVCTTDVLIAVMEVYGTAFERTLRAHGTDTNEVLERLRPSAAGSRARSGSTEAPARS